jgi:kynurenine formamidase
MSLTLSFLVVSVRVTAENIALAIHSGTHMDAPHHFVQNNWAIDEIPMTHFYRRPVVVIDIQKAVLKNVDYELTVQDLFLWEEENERIPEGSILLVRTGFSKKWPHRSNYFGGLVRTSLHFPGIHEDACLWLVQNRLVVGVGIDTASVDAGQGLGFKCHQILLGRNMFLIENLNDNIFKVPLTGASMTVFPLKITGASGSPCRVLVDYNSGSFIRPDFLTLTIILCASSLIGLIMSLACCGSQL